MSKSNRRRVRRHKSPVDPLSSQGIDKFLLDFHLESDLELSRSLASYESQKSYESNLNNITDMTNSDTTNQPMLPNQSTCVAYQLCRAVEKPGYWWCEENWTSRNAKRGKNFIVNFIFILDHVTCSVMRDERTWGFHLFQSKIAFSHQINPHWINRKW